MANRIPKEVIDNILERVDIVDVIENHLSLKKTGNNYTRCCPFHDEKTPSFSVNQKQQFYHCFGCKASGNAISFLMDYSGLDFVSTVEELASRCNVRIPDNGTLSKTPNHNYLIQTLEFAASFYGQQLRKSKSREKAIDYLKGRGISGEIAKEFRLGYAPEGWDNLINAHRSRSLKDSNLTAAGLVAEGKNKIYDRLRERIIFPIRNRRGQIIGFGGRTLGDQQPKYLNSPETALFQKGRELYGLYESLQKTKPREILVVEGYLDVISLHQAGLPYAVATLGTAITRNQMEKLFREASKLIFCFDGDAAGYKAAHKSLELSLPLLKNDRQINFSFLPDGSDPDSLIREVGAQHFFEHCEILNPSDFILKLIAKETSSEANESNAAIVARAKPYILSIPDSTQRAPAIRRLAEATGFDSRILWRELNPEKRERNENKFNSRLTDFVTRPLLDQLSTILLFYPSVSNILDNETGVMLQKEIEDSNFFLEVWNQARKENPNQAIMFERMRQLDRFDKAKELLSLELPFSEEHAREEFKDGVKKLKIKSQENIIKQFNHLPLTQWSEEQKQLVRDYKKNQIPTKPL